MARRGEAHADDPADGYRFIADELARRGFTASENRVWRPALAECGRSLPEEQPAEVVAHLRKFLDP